MKLIDKFVASKAFKPAYIVFFLAQSIAITMLLWFGILYLVFDEFMPDLPWYINLLAIAVGSVFGEQVGKWNLARVERGLERRGLS
jgi:hypothetical protein